MGIVSGKLRGQRAKAMKFCDGYMIKTGHAGQVYTDSAVRHVLLRQGVIGIKVSIMLPFDPEGKQGPSLPLDDAVTIHEPKEEVEFGCYRRLVQLQVPKRRGGRRWPRVM